MGYGVSFAAPPIWPTRPSRSRSRAADARSVAVGFDHDRVGSVHVTGRNGAYHHDRVVAVMPVPGTLAVIVERDLAMVAMMETLTVFVDHHVGILVVVVGLVVSPDDHVGFCRGRHCRHGKSQRQSAQDHKFRGNCSEGGMPSGVSTAGDPIGSGLMTGQRVRCLPIGCRT